MKKSECCTFNDMFFNWKIEVLSFIKKYYKTYDLGLSFFQKLFLKSVLKKLDKNLSIIDVDEFNQYIENKEFYLDLCKVYAPNELQLQELWSKLNYFYIENTIFSFVLFKQILDTNPYGYLIYCTFIKKIIKKYC